MISLRQLSVAFATTLVLLFLAVGQANATLFQTTFNFSALGNPGASPVGSTTIDRVVFDWSTGLTSGSVAVTDLTDWTITVFDGTTAVFTDDVIIGGVVQSIAGFTRGVSSASAGVDSYIRFTGNIDTLSVASFDNIVHGELLTPATGFLNVYNVGAEISFWNGSDDQNFPNIVTSAGVIKNTEAVSEPGILALFGVGLLGLGYARRKRSYLH